MLSKQNFFTPLNAYQPLSYHQAQFFDLSSHSESKNEIAILHLNTEQQSEEKLESLLQSHIERYLQTEESVMHDDIAVLKAIVSRYRSKIGDGISNQFLEMIKKPDKEFLIICEKIHKKLIQNEMSAARQCVEHPVTFCILEACLRGAQVGLATVCASVACGGVTCAYMSLINYIVLLSFIPGAVVGVCIWYNCHKDKQFEEYHREMNFQETLPLDIIQFKIAYLRLTLPLVNTHCQERTKSYIEHLEKQTLEVREHLKFSNSSKEGPTHQYMTDFSM
jgi:hypothetical protein